jgi:hypothetical protein
LYRKALSETADEIAAEIFTEDAADEVIEVMDDVCINPMVGECGDEVAEGPKVEAT